MRKREFYGRDETSVLSGHATALSPKFSARLIEGAIISALGRACQKAYTKARRTETPGTLNVAA